MLYPLGCVVLWDESVGWSMLKPPKQGKFCDPRFSKKKELDFAALESVLAEVAASSERPEVEASM